MVLNQEKFCPQRDVFTIITEVVLLASSGWRPRILPLNAEDSLSQQSMIQPQCQNIKIEKPWNITKRKIAYCSQLSRVRDKCIFFFVRLKVTHCPTRACPEGFRTLSRNLENPLLSLFWPFSNTQSSQPLLIKIRNTLLNFMHTCHHINNCFSSYYHFILDRLCNKLTAENEN